MPEQTRATLPEVLEELAQRADATGRASGRITAEGLRAERPDEGPPYEYGNALDAVLEMSPEERERVAEGFRVSFMAPQPRERANMEIHRLEVRFTGEELATVQSPVSVNTLYRTPEGSYYIYFDEGPDLAFLERGLTEEKVRRLWPELLEAAGI